MVVYGCVRDVAELAGCDTGIRALAPMPLPTEKRNEGQRDIPVRFAGLTFIPGHHLYADRDGIIIAARPLN